MINSVRVATGSGVDSVVDAVESVVSALSRSEATVGSTIGCAIAGAVTSSGHVSHALNLGFSDVDVRLALESRLARPVILENDVSAAAIGAGEVLDVDVTASSLVYLNIGTGLKAGVVLDGRVLRGWTGVAGEIGHLPIDPNGPLCICGQRGCIEAFVSGAALRRDWVFDEPHSVNGLMEHARRGDPHAQTVLSRFAFGVAAAVKVLAVAYDSAHILVGGGMVSGDWLDAVLADLRRSAEESPFLASLDLPRRVRALPEGRPYAAIGAACLARSANAARGVTIARGMDATPVTSR